MSKRNDCWGVEVGASAIKAIRLVRDGDQVKLAGYDILPFKQVLTTPDLNVDEAIQVNLDQFLQRHDMRKSAVWISVPGHMAFARFAKLPPVEPKKIADIVKFEAVQQIPFPIEQVEWDYQIFQKEDSPDVEVGIFAIAKDRVNQFLENYRAVGMGVDGVTLSPLAVFNGLRFDREEQGDEEGLVCVDIGATNTDVIVMAGDAVWLRTLPIGGNDFTEALVKAFKLNFAKAEKLKREAATSKYARQIFQAMRPVFADLVQELQRSLGYYQSLNREATLRKLVGVGSTFRLPGLQKFLKQQLQMDVVRIDSFNRIAAEGTEAAEFEQHALNMATAYGLAVQGLGLHTIEANVLPAQVLRQRVWRAKQPWFAAAAAMVVLAVGWNVTTLMGAKASYDESGFSQAQSVVRQAQEYEKESQELTQGAGARDKIETVRRLLDGKSIVPLILQDVQLAAASLKPQPQTLSADYQAIADIPRDQRQRVYIESVTLDYQAESATTGDRGRDEPAGDPTPSFVVTVKGTTPYRGGVGFFTETFIAWLRANAERENRPYKLIADNPLVMFAKNLSGASPANDSYGGRQTAGLGGRGQFGETPVNAGLGGGRSDRRVDLTALFPPRPGADEPANSDWRFEVRWTVQIDPPSQVRQVEESLGQPVSPSDASAQPSAGADAPSPSQHASAEDHS